MVQTFDEWWEANKHMLPHIVKIDAREAYNAALATANERISELENVTDFDAKRLRRLAVLFGVSVPESDEALLGCAGAVMGSVASCAESNFRLNDLVHSQLLDAKACCSHESAVADSLVVALKDFMDLHEGRKHNADEIECNALSLISEAIRAKQGGEG